MHLFKRIAFTAFFLFSLIFFVLLAFSIFQSISTTLSIEWKEAKAYIVESSYRISKRTKGTSYCPNIVYEYQTGGYAYKGHTTHHKTTPCFLSELGAKKFVSDFTKGKIVTMYYSAKNPRESALIVEVPWWMYLVFILLVPGCVVVTFLIYAFNSQRYNKK